MTASDMPSDPGGAVVLTLFLLAVLGLVLLGHALARFVG